MLFRSGSPEGAYKSFDGVHRLWKKSDPATTGEWERERAGVGGREEECVRECVCVRERER